MQAGRFVLAFEIVLYFVGRIWFYERNKNAPFNSLSIICGIMDKNYTEDRCRPFLKIMTRMYRIKNYRNRRKAGIIRVGYKAGPYNDYGSSEKNSKMKYCEYQNLPTGYILLALQVRKDRDSQYLIELMWEKVGSCNTASQVSHVFPFMFLNKYRVAT